MPEGVLAKIRETSEVEQDHRNQVVKFLHDIETELAFTVLQMFGNMYSKNFAYIPVDLDEGLIFAYYNSKDEKNIGFMYHSQNALDKKIYPINEEPGDKFWSNLQIILDWIPDLLKQFQKDQVKKLGIISDFEKIANSIM